MKNEPRRNLREEVRKQAEMLESIKKDIEQIDKEIMEARDLL